LAKYWAVFADNEIDWSLLPKLTEADLKELGLPSGPRKKLMEAVANFSAAGWLAEVEILGDYNTGCSGDANNVQAALDCFADTRAVREIVISLKLKAPSPVAVASHSIFAPSQQLPMRSWNAGPLPAMKSMPLASK
jgi:SAM domain (Sterile alpha motif)